MGLLPPSYTTKDRGQQMDRHRLSPPSPPSGIRASLEALRSLTNFAQPTSPTVVGGASERPDGQFALLRDSVVFNHERLLQNSQTHLLNTEHAHTPSMTTLHNLQQQIPEEDYVVDLSTSEIHPMPKLYSVAQPNRGNTNPDRSPPNWQDRHNSYDPRRVIHQADLHLALEKVDLQRHHDIPLSGTVASINLPLPSSDPVEDRQQLNQHQPSTPTVTTVYSYKCDRTNNRHSKDALLSTVPLRNSEDRNLAVFEERTLAMPYPSAVVDREAGDSLLPVLPGGESETLMDIQEQYEPDDVQQQELQTKRNELDLQVAGDYATDDDLDDYILRQPQPYFPNPDDLKWPEPGYLRSTLSLEYHGFLEPGFKKDCRVWLWKNEKGREARKLLAEYSADASRELFPHETN